MTAASSFSNSGFIFAGAFGLSMIGAWSPESIIFLSSLVRFVGIFVVVYFLAVVIYWFNRTGKIPPLRVIFRLMIQFARWFPRILVHRVRIVPARIRKKKVSAYPVLGISSRQKSKKLVRRKR